MYFAATCCHVNFCYIIMHNVEFGRLGYVAFNLFFCAGFLFVLTAVHFQSIECYCIHLDIFVCVYWYSLYAVVLFTKHALYIVMLNQSVCLK